MSKPYPEYKDSGIEWIGKIPKHWNIKKLKHDYQLIMGQSPDSNDYLYNENGTPFLQGNAEFGIKHPKPKIWCNKANKHAEKEDVLMSVRAPIGEINIADQKYGIGRGLCAIKAQIKIYKYLYYLLFCLKEEFNRIGAGTTYPGISTNDIKNVSIISPPYNEQQAIASYLDHKTSQLDDTIAKKQRLIDLLEEERQSIINKAVSKGLNPNVKMKDSGIEWIGQIPEHWDMVKLKYLTYKIGSGVTPKGGAEVYLSSGIPLIRSQNVHFEGLDFTEMAFISEEIHSSMSNSKVKPNDVLLNITGASIGRTCYIPRDFDEANVNQHVCILRPNKMVLTRYLYVLFTSKLGQTQISLSQTGSGREGLNFENLKNFVFPIPDINEQNEILNKIDIDLHEITSSKNKIQKQIDLLKEYRQSLIFEAVTGKIDVREEAEAISTSEELLSQEKND